MNVEAICYNKNKEHLGILKEVMTLGSTHWSKIVAGKSQSQSQSCVSWMGTNWFSESNRMLCNRLPNNRLIMIDNDASSSLRNVRTMFPTSAYLSWADFSFQNSSLQHAGWRNSGSWRPPSLNLRRLRNTALIEWRSHNICLLQEQYLHPDSICWGRMDRN